VSFKKSKIKKEELGEVIMDKVQELRNNYFNAKKKNIVSGILLGVFWIFIIWALALFTYSKISDFKIDFSFMNLLNIWGFSSIDPTKDKINVLLTGIWWGSHEWTDLTDTIILASISPNKKTVSMLSIPRDLYVSYPTGWAWRVNELYTRWLKKESEKNAMNYLKEKVEEITWEKIDYYANIDFDGFTKFVDLLDGIEVNVPKDLEDREYPDGNWWYEVFSIKKWVQTLDGKTALKYARSRHSTSDFDRSLRQQLVIKAIKEKLFDLKYISSPSKLKALFYTLSSNIKTDLTLKEIISLAGIAKGIPTENIFSFNLNTSCFDWDCNIWGFLYYGDRNAFGGASVVLPEWATASSVSSYKDINKFGNLVFNYPEIFVEKNEIVFVNTTKVGWLASKFASNLKRYWFNIPDKDSIFSTKDKFEKTKINYIWDSENKIWVSPESKTLEALSQFIFTTQEKVVDFSYTKNPNTKIEIILWSDYRLFLNN